MNDSSFFSNDLHTNTWRNIMANIEDAATVNNAIEGFGRAEGYALGLFESGKILDSQRKELAVLAHKSTVQRCNFLHGIVKNDLES